MDACRKEEINPSLMKAGWNQGFTLPLEYRVSLNSTFGRWLLRAQIAHHLKPTRSLAARGQRPSGLGNCPARPEQMLGPLVLRIFLQNSLKQHCLQLGNQNKELTSGSQPTGSIKSL